MRLDVIAAFNKLRIYFDNKNLIIFITTLESYKYYIFPFNLINGLSIF